MILDIFELNSDVIAALKSLRELESLTLFCVSEFAKDTSRQLAVTLPHLRQLEIEPGDPLTSDDMRELAYSMTNLEWLVVHYDLFECDVELCDLFSREYNFPKLCTLGFIRRRVPQRFREIVEEARPKCKVLDSMQIKCQF